MKFLAVFALVFAASSAQFLRDTPEVLAAKQQFADAYNSAARAAAAASPYAAPHTVNDDAIAPAAVPYVHEEIAAEPYVHVDIPAEPYVHIEPARGRTQNTYQAQPQVYDYNNYNNVISYQQPQQPYYTSNQGGCYNNLGEGVPCRTDFSQNY